MILDSLKNSAVYVGADDRLAMAFDFLSETDFSSFPDGKVELKGDEVFAIVQSYESKLIEDAKWEAHRKYIDVQFIVEGVEQIGVTKVDSLTPTTEYDDDGDCVLLEGNGDMLTLSAGDFAILHPWDAHMPGVAINTPSAVRKVVVKIKK